MAYDKIEVRESLTPEDMYDLLDSRGAEPKMQDNCIISKTICHNHGDTEHAKHKLYFYFENSLFHCYSGCDPSTFDVFDLLKKTNGLELNDAINYVVSFFNLQGKIDQSDTLLDQEDWKVMRKWEELSLIKINNDKVILPELDPSLLEHYPQPLILDWEADHIHKEVYDYMGVRYDPVNGAILIPHNDEDGRLVGIRQRTLVEDEKKFGKYRPWSHGGKQTNHPLGVNLYGLDKAKDNIKRMGVALAFESEKAVLAAIGYTGLDNALAVAVCGSNLSKYQLNLLLGAGAKEICIGFDADYHEIGDGDWEKVVAKLQNIYSKYSAYVKISFLFDTKGTMLGYKQSPTDCGREVFMELWRNRVYL